MGAKIHINIQVNRPLGGKEPPIERGIESRVGLLYMYISHGFIHPGTMISFVQEVKIADESLYAQDKVNWDLLKQAKDWKCLSWDRVK